MHIPGAGAERYVAEIPEEYFEMPKEFLKGYCLSFVSPQEGWTACSEGIFHTENGGFDPVGSEGIESIEAGIISKNAVSHSEIDKVVPRTHVRWQTGP